MKWNVNNRPATRNRSTSKPKRGRNNNYINCWHQVIFFRNDVNYSLEIKNFLQSAFSSVSANFGDFSQFREKNSQSIFLGISIVILC